MKIVLSKIQFFFIQALSLIIWSSIALTQANSTYTFSCEIIDPAGKLLRKYPGWNCIYLDSGEVIWNTQFELLKLSNEGTLDWQKPLNAHHTFRLLDNEHFLLLNSSIHQYKDKRVRFDRISIFDLKGNELKYFDFYDHQDELLSRAMPEYRDFLGETFIGLRIPDDSLTDEEEFEFISTPFEFAHANSVYEIPKNSISRKIKAFKKGNFIVNVNGLCTTFILSQDFKNILWSIPFSILTKGSSIHDVQIDASGKSILYYENNYTDKSSAIAKYDPISGVKKLIYTGNESELFYAESQGGVQELENHQYLISQFNKTLGNRIFIVNEQQQIKWSLIPTQEGILGLPLGGMQEVKRLNLVKFLKNNKYQ